MSRHAYLAAVLILLLAGCSQATDSEPAAESNQDNEALVMMVTPEFVLGDNELRLRVVTQERDPIEQAQVKYRLMAPGEEDPRPPLSTADRGDGYYGTTLKLDHTGPWNLLVEVNKDGRTLHEGVLELQVRQRSTSPALGEDVPPSLTPVGTTVEERRTMCTAQPPCDLHRGTVKQAAAAGKPAVILFASPARCTSGVCGPQLEIVQELAGSYGGRATFIHVEIFKVGSDLVLDAVTEWGLTTEPWTFILDSEGKVAVKLGGFTPKPEIEEALKAVL